MNPKVLIAFVGGVVLASAVAFFAVRQSSTTAAPATGTVSAVSTPATQAAAPAPTAPAPAEPAAAAAAPAEAPMKPSPAATPRTRKSGSTQLARNQPPAVQQPAPAPTPAPSEPAPAPKPVESAPPAVAPQAEPTPPPAPAPPPRQAQTVTIPAGTLLNVRLGETLTSDRNAPGDSFTGTLDQPLVIDGLVIAERGARVEGRVVQSEKAGRVKGVSDLAIELVRINTADGQRIRVTTETFQKQGEHEVGKDAAKVGAAAGIGAAIGAIAGGGKGAAIGAAVGGAAGAGGVLATRGKAAEIRVETRIPFRLKEAVTVTEKLK